MGKQFFDDDGNTVEGGPSSFGRSFPNKERGRGGNFRGGQRRDNDSGGKRYFDQDSEGGPPHKFHKKFDDGEGETTQSEDKKKLYENTVDMSSYGYQRKPWQQRDRGGFSGGRGGRSNWGDRRQEDNGEDGGSNEREGGFRGGRGGFRGGRREWGDKREEENGEEGGGFSGGRGGFRGGRGGGGFRGGRRDWGDRREEDNGEEGG
ncbi:hypothetical protein PFISCL1PPCAC_6342, partial [Pristionchus fissidentatus]